MVDVPSVLLTNDDGVDAPGLAAIRDALRDVADVTVVAPTADHSGAGRRNCHEAAVERRVDAVGPPGDATREGAVVLDGPPAACVQAGLDRYAPDADLVVAGCNPGPNVGEHVVGRSATVGAAREAAFLGTPGLALSLYDPPTGGREFAREEFAEAGRFARFAVDRGLDDGLFGGAPVLNVNVPADPPEPLTVRVTESAACRDVVTSLEDGVLTFRDTFYDGIRPDHPREMDHPTGSDVRALDDLELSVTPLRPGLRTGAVDEPSVAAYRGWRDD